MELVGIQFKWTYFVWFLVIVFYVSELFHLVIIYFKISSVCSINYLRPSFHLLCVQWDKLIGLMLCEFDSSIYLQTFKTIHKMLKCDFYLFSIVCSVILKSYNI